MNNLTISGVIASDILPRNEGENEHSAFDLVVRHTTKAGKAKKEYFRVNTWNGMAAWAVKNLQPGQIVAVSGYLIQRQVAVGETVVRTTEICAKEIVPGASPAAIRRTELPSEPVLNPTVSREMSATDFGKRLSEAVEKVLAEGVTDPGQANAPEQISEHTAEMEEEQGATPDAA